ncbi:hypothetical protein TKK_0009316 [Trichogramma kaykai]
MTACEQATHVAENIATLFEEFETQENPGDEARGAEKIRCPHVDIILNSRVEIQALVDTGATVTCLQEEFFEANKENFKNLPILPLVNTVVTGFRGEKSVRIKKQIRIPTTIQGISAEINFLGIPRLAKTCILGVDAFNSYGTIINVPQRKIAFESLQVITDDRDEPYNQGISMEEIEQKVQGIEADDKTRIQLKNLCVKHSDCFRKVPGRFRSYEHTIIMKNDEPFFLKSYPIPDKYREQVSQEVAKMLRQGIIERSTTPYISPLVVVPKKDGSVRLCLDARQINDRMQEDHDGPEEIDQVLRRCQEIGVMSSLDLRASFWQVPLAIDSRKYTGFTHQGYTYQYTSVPFGLKISSAALNRAAETILRDMKNEVIAFVDDWLIVSPTIEQHLVDLDNLLTRISDENVTVNFKKFELLRKEIRFVGFVLTPEGIKADDKKTEAIMKFPTPTTPTQIRGFLGLVNFNSRFTARLAEAAAPLIELTTKEKAWQWSEREKQAFENVKNLFCTELFLHHPRQDRGYVLFTDASQKALGSALCQEIEPGDMRIIYMASRTLKGAELNYYTTELELLAILWALEKFRSYVYGRQIEIRTDHQALTFLRTSRFLSQRLLRWSLMIPDYNLTIKHIPGKANLLADILSRPPDMPSEQTNEGSIYALLARQPKASILKDLKQLRSLQAEDAHLKRLQASEKGQVAIDSTGLIIWKDQRGTRCYLPQALLRPLVAEIHELYGHIGPKKCAVLISESFYFPNLGKHTHKILKSCDFCQRNKTYTVEIQGISQPILVKQPNDLLSIDFIGPFPPSKNGARFALITVDAFSRFTQIYPIPRATCQATVKCLVEDYFPKYGHVKTIQSDHGSQFTSKPWTFCMNRQNIKIIFSSIRHPQSNLVERYNKEIGRFLRTLARDDHPSWAYWCSTIAEIMNTTVNQTTGFCPLEVHTGKKPERFWLNMYRYVRPIKRTNKFVKKRERILREREIDAPKSGTRNTV